ncbi:MAG: hypothetical protein SXV54_03450 [Chloroflexota bacterium]|nr:hypothetical protein [Chloroflexota bacterium]
MARSESGLATVVVTLLAALVGFGVQQWGRLAEEEQERRQRREEALAEIESLKAYLRDGRFDQALERYRELGERTQPPWQDDVIRERLDTVWREAAPPELQRWVLICGSIAQEASSDEEEIRTVVWAYSHLLSATVDAPEALKRFFKPATIETTEKVLVKDADGLRLLRNRALIPTLEEIGQHSDPKVRDCAARLLARQRRPARWISPWPKVRLPDHPHAARGVQALELPANPFGPERAESDPLLEKYGVRPRGFWNRICGPRPVLAFGSPGSGKTAAALLLAYDCGFPPASPREMGAFPVYNVPWLDVPRKMSGRAQLDQIARALTEALLQAAAKDPYLFKDSPGKTAIAYLMLWYLGSGSPDGVALHLQRVGLEPSGAGVAILKEVQKLASSASLNLRPDETTLLDLLGQARPSGCVHTYVLMDLGIEPDAARMKAISNSVYSLLERTVHLARNGVYIKAFLPKRLRASLDGDLPVESVELSWRQKDLQEMLEMRLAHIGLPSLSSIYLDPEGIRPHPDRRLVEAAGVSPRQLVRLGNQMLAHVKAPPLKPEHLPGGKE